MLARYHLLVCVCVRERESNGPLRDSSESFFGRLFGCFSSSRSNPNPSRILYFLLLLLLLLLLSLSLSFMALCAFIVFFLLAEAGCCLPSQVYVVYMGSKISLSPDETSAQNHQMLTAIHGGSSEKAAESHVYSYTSGFRGFAAKLTSEQASEVAEMPGVVSVFQSTKRSLHTTHSWDFMGINMDEAMEIPGYSTVNQENVIIGFIDTGIWPESSSFRDEGMPSVPSRWKGQCETGESFSNSSCNKKIIGARYYLNGYQAEEGASKIPVKYRSARDSGGHGTHTASTAAGRYVNNMNYNGLAAGEARSGVPMARVAVYKACWDSGCYDADLLAAFDDAIKDGVDIISVSLGPGVPQQDYFTDPLSIGSFHATNQGILVVASCGNDGSPGSVTNVAPWMLTVAASSTDRDFMSYIIMGNQENITGESLNTLPMSGFTSIISASEANDGYFTPYQSSFCLESSLNRTKARGRILVCRHSGSSEESRLAKNVEVQKAGGVGMILIDETEEFVALPFTIPALSVGRAGGDKILSYINHTRSPRALILPTKAILGSRPAPRVASFSSRGPNSLTPDILKPDIAAPGLNILAAWSPAANKMDFNILSGTSMSCPHVTGLAALIKAVNPSWSPAQIKSAVMTTATVLDKKGNAITSDPEGRLANSFDFGSGFAEPLRVLNSGLVYDAQPSDYKAFLCSIGYDDESLQKVTGDYSTCLRPSPPASDLNYPSITVSDLKDNYSISRIVTNVGESRSVYRAFVSPPAGINVTVVPKTLVFRRYGQKMKFRVSFKVSAPSTSYAFGSLSWRGKDTNVTSPLVVRVTSSGKGLFR